MYNSIKLLVLVATLLGSQNALYASEIVDAPKEPIPIIELGNHTGQIGSLSLDRAGKWLVSSSTDYTIRVWDALTGRLERIIRPPKGQGPLGVQFASISPDGNLIAASGNTQFSNTPDNLELIAMDGCYIYLFNRSDGRMLASIGEQPGTVINSKFSPDGQYLAIITMSVPTSSKNYRLRIFKIEHKNGNTFIKLTSEIIQDNLVADFDFSSNGKQLVVVDVHKSLKLYDVSNLSKGNTDQISELSLIAEQKLPGSSGALQVRFSPDNTKIALSFITNEINVVSAVDLKLLYAPNTAETSKENGIHSIVWSSSGESLFASFKTATAGFVIRRWDKEGQGEYRDHLLETFKSSGMLDLVHVIYHPNGSLIISPSNPPVITSLEHNGQTRWSTDDKLSRFSITPSSFMLSTDGNIVAFDTNGLKTKTIGFSIRERSLIIDPDMSKLRAPRESSFINSNRSIISLKSTFGGLYSTAPDDKSFLISMVFSLKQCPLYGKTVELMNNKCNWVKRLSNNINAVNISEDGQLAVAALADGTIRWYRYSDGKELAALLIHPDRKRWIIWTPEGFFDHSPGGEELIGFHLNHGKDHEAEFIPVSKLYNQFYRPDLVYAAFEGKDLSEYSSTTNINKILSINTMAPKVRLLTQSGKAKGFDTVIKAELCDNGGGIGDITLYLNGMPVTVTKGGRGLKVVSKAAAACSIFEHTITLADGDNEISLMAYNKNMTIESNRDSVKLSYASGNKAKPDLHILTVAVNSYRDGDLKLSYSVPDAKAIAESFKGNSGKLFGKIVVHQLLDAQVTKTGMDKTFAEIGRKTGRDDVFILFVAGHGITGTKDGAYYFIPYDFRYTGEEAVAKQGVSMDDFKGYLANVNALKSIILLDTCNSGSFTEALASRGMVEKTAINKLSRAVGRATIVASSKSQVALEGYEGHGAFTWTILDGLKGKAADGSGKITINGLATYVEELLPQITYKKWGFEQIPQKNLHGMDFQIGVR